MSWPKVIGVPSNELTEGAVADAEARHGSDAILAWRLWPILTADLQRCLRWAAYELQRRAIPAVADMKLRGLGIDREAHARQARYISALKRIASGVPPRR